jgi:hypothetical protein
MLLALIIVLTKPEGRNHKKTWFTITVKVSTDQVKPYFKHCLIMRTIKNVIHSNPLSLVLAFTAWLLGSGLVAINLIFKLI